MYYMTPLWGLGAADPVTGNPGDVITENAAIPVDDIAPDLFLPEEERPAPVVDPEEDDDGVTREEVTSAEWMIPSSLATQIFSIVPGIAGGLAGFVLASKLSNAKSVKATEVLMASGSVALITFLSVFLVKTIDEFD